MRIGVFAFGLSLAFLGVPAYAEVGNVLRVSEFVSPKLGSAAIPCPVVNTVVKANHSKVDNVVPIVIAGALLGGAVGASIAHAPATHLGYQAIRNAAVGGALLGGAISGSLASKQGKEVVKPACGQTLSADNSASWYEVVYEYQGRVYRDSFSYDPGKTVYLDAAGNLVKVPFDN